MKSIVKFSGIIALALSVLGFILIMATPSLVVDGGIIGKANVSGIDGIFGDAAQWCGTLAWIFVLISIIVLALTILPMLKVNALEKFNRIFAIVAAVLLVIAGIITFIEASAANSEVGLGLNAFKLGGGWIVSGILFIIAGLFSILPVFIKAE